MLKYSNFVNLRYNEYTDEYYSVLSNRLPQIFEEACLNAPRFIEVLSELDSYSFCIREMSDSNDCPDSIRVFDILFTYNKEDDIVKFEYNVERHYSDNEGDLFIEEHISDAEKFCKLVNSYSSDYGL